jgi:Holliday junction resolvase RusA-like endonuclease
VKRSISFFVPGLPAPGGSKRAFIPKGWTRAVVTDAGGKKTRDWRAAVALAAYAEMQRQEKTELFDGALHLSITFEMPRPKGHYNSKGALKPKAPVFVTSRPDSSKLVRSTEDALTGVCWHDDAQVAVQAISRVYGEQSGAHIKVETLEHLVAELVKIVTTAQENFAFTL